MTTVHEAWSAVMAEVRGLGKHQRNSAPNGNYNFRGIDAVMNAVGPALRAHNVIVTPNVRSVHKGTATTSKGHLMTTADVVVEYTISGPEGDEIVTSAPGEAFDSGDKATSKAMSVAYRTMLLQALTLPTDEPDPDESTYDRQQPQQEQRFTEVPPLRRAQARAWEAAVRAYPNATDDQRRAETIAVMAGLDTDPARATTDQWEQTADILEGNTHAGPDPS